MKFKLKREPTSNLFLIAVQIDEIYELSMILDTGASHTTIDSNALHLLGYDFVERKGSVEIETANGVILTDVYEISSLSSLGVRKENIEIQVYDFIAHGIFSDYNGVVGLDFLQGLHFCIDTIENTIKVN